jgi:hypothetical protein
MSSVVIPFWQLRQHAVADEAVRGSRRRRTEPWILAEDLVPRLRPLLEPHGFDLAREIRVEELADANAFRFFQ